jgi:ABC-type transporter Mla MlaB component
MPASALAPSGNAQVDVDVAWLVSPDLAAVDALARLQLTAVRRGRSLCLHGADDGLVELLEFVGLGRALYVCAGADPLAGDIDGEVSDD